MQTLTWRIRGAMLLLIVAAVATHVDGSTAALRERGIGLAVFAALRSFTELAKLDHSVFKFEVYKVFMGVSEKSAGDFAAGNRALEQMEGASHEVLACLERMAVCGESHPEIRCSA